MAASLAFAGFTGVGCRRWEREEMVPLPERAAGYVPGVTRRYATGFELGGCATGLLVTSIDGRPIKIESNPGHPFPGGGSPLAQASLLELYDPDRSRRPYRRENGRYRPATWDDFTRLIEALPGDCRLHVLSEPSGSPTLAALHSARHVAGSDFPHLAWHEYEPLTRDHQRAGLIAAFGRPLRPRVDLAATRTLVALDVDLFTDHPAAPAHAAGFAAARRPDGASTATRLYAVESCFSSTGALADHRLPLRSELILPLVLELRARLAGTAGPGAAFLADPEVADFCRALVADLTASAGGGSVVMAGPRQPPAVHAQVAALNQELRAERGALRYLADPDPDRPGHVDALVDLVRAIDAGTVDALLVIGGNPVYDAPVDVDFGAALARVPVTLRLGRYRDETSDRCQLHLPLAHYLESWGDTIGYDGTVTVLQPMIAPLGQGRSAIEVMRQILDGKIESGEIVVRTTARVDDPTWRRMVHDGLRAGTALPVEIGPDAPPPAAGATPLRVGELPAPLLDDRQLGGLALDNGELELVLTPSPHSHDGRFANNGWLQETPAFPTGVTWDNPARIAPRTAAALGVVTGDLVALELDGRSVELPVCVVPGQAPGSIAVALGHGRRRAGRVGGDRVTGVAPVGVDAYPLRSRDQLYLASGLTVRRTGGHRELAILSDCWPTDARGRREVARRAPLLVRSASHADYRAHVERCQRLGRNLELGANHPPDLTSLWDPPHRYTGHKWGMAIDLNKCTGCNACLLACQAENNVPVVGRARVLERREMHWLRIDRYFVGDRDRPTLLYQPVACHHCDRAPCEEVCPVGATVHSDEGLNDMAYNRCVGTRYCMNNCPYRVRRFNYFDYRAALTAPDAALRRLAVNPDVTVRSRGVMEKCSFCVQRIERAKIEAKNAGRPLARDAVVTACQQACPTGAIVFGDLGDPDSEVSRLHASPRAYAMLGHFNTRPATVYLARIRNPNPDLDRGGHG